MASLLSFFFLSRISSFSFFILFLFFSVHARKSSARSLRAITSADSLKEFLDNCKVKIGEKIEHRNDSFDSQGTNNAKGHQHSNPSGRIPDDFDSIFGSKAVKKKDKDPRWKSGKKVVESSSGMNFVEATKTEARFREENYLRVHVFRIEVFSLSVNVSPQHKKQVSRGSAAEQDMTLEAIGSHNIIGDEDIVKTDDYQRQHQDSPIHNK